MKHLWTLLRAFISFMRYGFQATEEYSKIGLTYTLYDATNDWMLFEWKQRMIKLALLCVLSREVCHNDRTLNIVIVIIITIIIYLRLKKKRKEEDALE